MQLAGTRLQDVFHPRVAAERFRSPTCVLAFALRLQSCNATVEIGRFRRASPVACDGCRERQLFGEQVVIGRDEEASRPGLPLASGPPDELSIDTSRPVPFGRDDV